MNPLHLTRDNYEEAFLLYVDDELTAEQKAAVEAFAAQHPDLQEELQLLLGTKLPLADDVPVLDKSFLMADSMKVNAIDEDLLLYIDNELPAAQKAAVAQRLKEDKDYSLQHQLLAKTKLDPTEIIPYPNKEELYRKTERRIYAHWWRVAAAAVVILWAGTTTDWFDNSDSTAAGSTAGNNTVALRTQPAEPAAPAATGTAAPANKEDNNTNSQAPSPVEEVIVNNQKEKAAFAPAGTQQTAVSTVADNNAVPPGRARRVTDVQVSVDYIPATPQQIFKDALVTSAEPVRTISTDAHAATPVPVDDAVAAAGPEKSGSLKGFLRKTTRFIERTTSINPVNADDELLIGALAIKVK